MRSIIEWTTCLRYLNTPQANPHLPINNNVHQGQVMTMPFSIGMVGFNIGWASFIRLTSFWLKIMC